MSLLLPLALGSAMATIGPDAAVCARGDRPAVIVHIAGFANRSGRVRVRLFGPPISSYFDKERALRRIEVPVPPTGAVALCVVAPAAGIYALDVRHDVNGDGRTDRGDGGGASGNPHVTLLDVLFKRRPDPAKVQFTVGRAPLPVHITLTYLRGGSFRPVDR